MGEINATIRVKRATKQWLQNRILEKGEMAYETDSHGIKIGDGARYYKYLSYLIPSRNGSEGKYLKIVNGEAIWASGETYDDTNIWNAVNTKYTKPASGIPKIDMDLDVQQSLGKADTALQSFTETDPTVPSWAKQSSKPTYDYSEITNTPTIPTVNDATLKIQRNGTDLDTFTANASQNKTINIVVPTTASDVSALPASTKYGASLSLSINSSTYVITAQLKDQDNNNLGEAKTIDLPLESVVVNGSYDDNTKKIILTLQNGNTVEFSVADLVSGLQTEITSDNPLSADLIADGTTNKVYTSTEQSKLSGIQAGAEVNVQSDWNESDNTSKAFINHKPTIPDSVSGTNDGTNWTSITIGSDTYAIPSGGGGGGLSDYDFTELSAPTISGGACTITFAANKRNAVEFSTNADLSIALVSNNKADNYIWITNSHATDAIDVTFSSIMFGSTVINDIKGTASIPSIEAGETIEIGIYVTGTKARITSRIL